MFPRGILLTRESHLYFVMSVTFCVNHEASNIGDAAYSFVILESCIIFAVQQGGEASKARSFSRSCKSLVKHTARP